MKRIEYEYGTFLDYNQKVRYYTVAYVIVNEGKLAFTSEEITNLITNLGNENCLSCALDKSKPNSTWTDLSLYVGLAITRADDTYNVELGKRIALGKALNSRSRAFECNISSEYSHDIHYLFSIMDHLSEVISLHPERFCKAYKEAQIKTHRNKLMDNSMYR